MLQSFQTLLVCLCLGYIYVVRVVWFIDIINTIIERMVLLYKGLCLILQSKRQGYIITIINIERNKKMSTLKYLGLDEKKVQPVVEGLSQLLADFQVFYANLRGLHWNVKGKRFFSLHAKYEELYNDAAEKIDEIAERLLQLGATPENRFSEYLKVSSIKETGNQPTGKEGVEIVLDNLSNLIKQERELSKLASEIDDNATVGLIDGFLEGQEKTVWMLVSFLDKSYKK